MPAQTILESENTRRDELTRTLAALTEGAILQPNELQRALFPRLLTFDAGLLVPTGPGAGRLEAVFVPAVIRRTLETGARRLYIIGPDGSPLDDYVYRLVPYIQALTAWDGMSRTLYIEDGEHGSLCGRYHPDGACDLDVCNHPLDPSVDLAICSFSRFRSLFFGAGGIHALPQSSGSPEVDGDATFPRDLFYFDDAHGYGVDEYSSFLRLAQFLYAQDFDVVVGSSTLPNSSLEDLSFLEKLIVESAANEPCLSLQVLPKAGRPLLDAVEEQVRSALCPHSRVIACVPTPNEAGHLVARLEADGLTAPLGYHCGQAQAERMKNYQMLKGLEKEGLGYLLVTDGAALETSDLDAAVLVTAGCLPEQLVRRAGRCNRRGSTQNARIVVVGEPPLVPDRLLAPDRRASYLDALSSVTQQIPFDAGFWKTFIA